jgi:hypothetical protein
MAARGRDGKAARLVAQEYIHHVAGERGPSAAWPSERSHLARQPGLIASDDPGLMAPHAISPGQATTLLMSEGTGEVT